MYALKHLHDMEYMQILKYAHSKNMWKLKMIFFNELQGGKG